MKQKEPKPFAMEETLTHWAETARDALVDLAQMPPDQATRIGREMAVRFAEDHAGAQIYIAKGMSYALDVRDEEILAEFNGRNYSQLAKKHKISIRHIRRIILRAEVLRRIVRDDDLFGGLSLPGRG